MQDFFHMLHVGYKIVLKKGHKVMLNDELYTNVKNSCSRQTDFCLEFFVEKSVVCLLWEQ